jgi:hypothetical protein
MISRREFMAGSVALAASSASTRLAPEPFPVAARVAALNVVRMFLSHGDSLTL